MTEEKMSTKKTQEKQISSEEIQQLLEQDQEARVRKCQSEIDIILKENKCQLVALPRLTPDGRIITAVFIKVSEEDSKLL